MPWPFSESIKKRACRYLLQRYLGHFLQEKLSLEQLTLDLYQGTGSLAQVPLDKWVRHFFLSFLLRSVSFFLAHFQPLCQATLVCHRSFPGVLQEFVRGAVRDVSIPLAVQCALSVVKKQLEMKNIEESLSCLLSPLPIELAIC